MRFTLVRGKVHTSARARVRILLLYLGNHAGRIELEFGTLLETN